MTDTLTKIQLASDSWLRTADAVAIATAAQGEFDGALASAQAETTTLRTELTATEAALTETKSDLTQTKSDLTETKADLTQARASLAQTAADLAQTSQDLQTATSNLTAAQAQLTTSGARLTALEGDLASAQATISTLRIWAPDTIATVGPSGSVSRLRQGLAVVTNEFIYPAGEAAAARMAPYIASLYETVSYHLSGGFGSSDWWAWNPANGPRPSAPTGSTSMPLMVKFANRFGLPHLFTIYRPSWWMKRVRGTPLTYADVNSNEKGRLSGEFKAEWEAMVEDMVFAAAKIVLEVDPAATFRCQVHNEFKGFWELLVKDQVVKGQNWADGENPGTPGYGDMDYGPYYKLTVNAAKRAFARLGVPEARVKWGGAYAVLQSEGKRSVNSLPAGHPLADRPWGTMTKQPIYASERFLAYAKREGLPLHFFVVDGGVHNKDLVHPDSFLIQLKKVSDANRYLRAKLDELGYAGTEIWWAERYLTERPGTGLNLTAQQDSMARRAAVTTAGLCEMALSGAATIFQWGLRGEDGDPYLAKENAAYFAADGSPTELYWALKRFKDAFPAETTVYPLEFDRPGAYGMAGGSAAVLVNATFAPLKVHFDGTTYGLNPNEVLYVPR